MSGMLLIVLLLAILLFATFVGKQRGEQGGLERKNSGVMVDGSLSLLVEDRGHQMKLSGTRFRAEGIVVELLPTGCCGGHKLP